MISTAKRKVQRGGSWVRAYPWEEWFLREGEYLLVKGRDYNCRTNSMVVMFRQKATAMGMRVSLRVDEENPLGERISVKVLGQRN